MKGEYNENQAQSHLLKATVGMKQNNGLLVANVTIGTHALSLLLCPKQGKVSSDFLELYQILCCQS